MAATHPGNNIMKMPGPLTIISVPFNKKDALICADQLYREAVAAAAVKAPAPAAEGPGGKKKPGKTSCTHSGKHTSSECCATVEDAPSSSTGKCKTKSGKSSDAHSGKRTSSECCATIEDVPERSTDKSKKSRAEPPQTKRVSAGEDGT